MRKLFWILLLANVAFFAVMHQGWLGEGEQASQAQPDLHADMIRLVDAPVSLAPVSAASVPAKASVMVPPPVHTPVAASAPVHVAVAASLPSVVLKDVNAPEVDQPSGSACLEWGEFSGQDLSRATEALSAMQLGDKLNQYQVEHNKGYWVYIPPLRNKAAVRQKIEELKVRGINEYFVVQDAGKWRNAISLGVFKTKETAQHFLDDLRANKDINTARVGQRASKFNVTIFRLNGVGILTEVKLAALQKDFSGSELKRVPCALTK